MNRKLIVTGSLSLNPFCRQTEVDHCLAADPRIIIPASVAVMAVITDNGPEGIGGPIYRATAGGKWRQSAFITSKAHNNSPAVSGLLALGEVGLREVPDGAYKLAYDRQEQIQPMAGGARWSASTSHIKTLGGTPLETWGAGIGGDKSSMLALLQEENIHEDPLSGIPGMKWGLRAPEDMDDKETDISVGGDSVGMIAVGPGFYRALVLGASAHMARQKDRGYTPSGRTASGLQISQLHGDIQLAAKQLCDALTTANDDNGLLHASLDAWKRTGSLFASFVMYGSQVLAACKTILGPDEGVDTATQVLQAWMSKYQSDRTQPKREWFADLKAYPGGERVVELAEKWATATESVFRAAAGATSQYAKSPKAGLMDTWLYGAGPCPLPAAMHAGVTQVLDLGQVSPIIITEKPIAGRLPVEAPDVVRQRRVGSR